MSSLQVRDVRKSYGDTEVIQGVTIDIDDGEFVVLVGPSGCGKSTLLRMIAGLEEISGGEISIASKVVNRLEPKDRDIAMVFQNYALYPHMTVEQNMGFALDLAKKPKAETRGKVLAVAEQLGLEPLMSRKPSQLSGGQRQRVAMGRAMVRDPKVFLFDEPLSNLDAKLRVQVRSEIKSLHQRLKSTIVYVTHDQIEAMTMADRIVVMRSGLVEQIGTPLELYDRPSNLFVAAFIGSPSMNLVEGTVVGNQVLSAEGSKWQLPDGSLLSEGANVTVGFRPEHISFVEGKPNATIKLIEPTGAETLIEVDMVGELIVAAMRERSEWAIGQEVSVAVSPEHLHLFDTSSGRRI